MPMLASKDAFTENIIWKRTGGYNSHGNVLDLRVT